MTDYLLRSRLLTALFSLVCSAPLFAGVSEQVVQDFKALSGYVVGQNGQSYIIDLDAADGLSVGDVVTVVEPGAVLTHPVSGESLGRLEKIKAVLKVTQLRAGFSLARPVGAPGSVARGDPIRRYQNVQAAFHDYTGDGEPLYLELRSALPTLQWQDYTSATEPGAPASSAEAGPLLLFELRQEGLTVRDAESRVLKTYAWPGTVIGGAQRATPSPVAVPAPPAAAAQATRPVPDGSAREGFQVQFPQRERIAKFPEQVQAADFIRFQGRMLVATSDGTGILVSEADERMSPVAAGEPTTPGRILSVHWWQPEEKGPPLLVANVWKEHEHRPEGAIFALRGSRLVSVRETVLFVLGTFDRDGDGRRELLLGQSFDPEPFFGRRVRALTLRGSKLHARKPGFRLPRGFSVQGATFADVTGDGRPELAFVHNNILYLHDLDGQLLHRSAATLGGSLSVLTYDVAPSMEFSPVTTVPFELSPVAADLNGDGVAELIAVAGELGAVSNLNPGAKKSWLVVLAFRDGAFVMGKLGPEFDVPMQGLVVDDSRLLLITPESHSSSFFRRKTAASHLLAISLQR